MRDDLKFCPRCANAFAWRSFEYADIKHPVCTSCGFVLWQNLKPSVEALIVREGARGLEVLLGRRGDRGGDEPVWDAPGGFLNVDDRLESALVRECKREMGIEVRVGEIVGAFEEQFFGETIISLVYRCELASGEPRAADIIDDVGWFPLSDPPAIAYPSIRRAIDVLAAAR